MNEDDKREQSASELKSYMEDSRTQAAKDRKARRRRLVGGAVAVVVLAGAAGGGGWAYWRHVERTTTLVPVAADYLPASVDGTAPADPCEPFTAAQMECTAVWGTSDTLRRGQLAGQSVVAGQRVKKGTGIEVAYSSGPASSVMPNVVGRTLEEARQVLYDLGVEVGEIKVVEASGAEENTVTSVSVPVGQQVSNGDKVSLEVSSGRVTLPDWTGKTKEAVDAEARSLGVEVDFTEEESQETPGTVLSQTPKAGEAQSSAAVKVVVAKGFEKKAVTVPDVIGKTVDAAQTELAAAGFRHITTAKVPNCQVSSPQVTQVVPGVGSSATSEDNVVVIASEPDAKCSAGR